MTLRLFYDYFIGETTTIGYDYSRSYYDYSSRNAATIADLYWLSGESPKRDAAQAANGSAAARRWTSPPGGVCALTADRCQTSSRRAREASNLRRADPVQVETLTRRRVRRAQHLPAIRTQWEKTPPGLHGLRYAAPSYIPYYNRAAVLTCAASRVAQVVQYRQMQPPHNGGKTKQIARNATAKPCALFCGVGCITAWMTQNAL